ncbi:sulfatase-like hydrolase/transferase [Prosthecobacter sp. SYSU 5D2]|uniref:sulfatase family protein n=1 Tax=Prosthecobacter sp. SYSU 5D2 TaxID=3134134 RepID=UPI0031FF149E
MKWSAPALLLCVYLSAVQESPAAKPDVLVILTDQWSPRYLSWENPQVRTPNLDRIAAEGMIFDRCYTTSPVCMPARVSLLTGQYPHNGGHALWGNSLEYHPAPKDGTMFRDIKEAGYTTAQIGKTHWTGGGSMRREFASDEDYHKALGLDHVMDVSGPPSSAADKGPYGKYLKELGLLKTVAEDMHERYVRFQYLPKANPAPPEHYHDTFVTQKAVEFIHDQPAEKPLCVVVSLHSPHPPLDAPGEYATMYDPEELTLPPNVPETYRREMRMIDHAETRKMVANYLGKITLADEHVGRLAAAFQKRGTWDNTLVLFTADHGEMMGAQGQLTKGRFFEESARVPLMIRWPGKVKAGRTKALAQMFDVYPTIVDAIGGKLSPYRQAVSLMPVASGEKKTVRHVAISEIGTKSPLNIMASDERYKWWMEKDQEFLFDLKEDPYEMKNLAADPEHFKALSQMRARMLTHLRNTQTNHAEGYVPMVDRLRDKDAAKKGIETKKKRKGKTGEP